MSEHRLSRTCTVWEHLLHYSLVLGFHVRPRLGINILKGVIDYIRDRLELCLRQSAPLLFGRERLDGALSLCYV